MAGGHGGHRLCKWATGFGAFMLAAAGVALKLDTDGLCLLYAEAGRHLDPDCRPEPGAGRTPGPGAQVLGAARPNPCPIQSAG
eukprot:CAMPEP_0206026302 /NCGR_PEP_ID=MMETSP1464-20131121/41469_1 /ASSEMBLY_ACC=CAM_ASM_001124 /TAXON_ID=119497 /ORGANISM="Exanthemachrysis gayraliae, Strain RCC1523" /LENGTH=82 /DNA_ID=CAMNT_0053400345 /DNA_START=1 /DNA_END=245 /DNA_ORIENTATION=-